MVIVVGNPALGNPQSSLYCAEPKVINYDPTTLLGDCSCLCPSQSTQSCIFPQVYKPEECGCGCPSFAPDPSTCSAPLVWRPELCQCACAQGSVGGPCIDNTPTSCLIRSDSLCGYNINPRDVVHAFRVFDAYNNVENQRAVSEAVLAANKHYQAAITFSSHQDETLFNDAWVAYMAESFAKLGAHSICIKDMAGIASPYLMGKWVRSIKTAVPELPVHIHSHYTTGFSPITYIQAIEAGASCIDCGISTLSGRSGHPAMEVFNQTLYDMGYDLGWDYIDALEAMKPVADLYREYHERYEFCEMKMAGTVDYRVFTQGIPGGQISIMRNELVRNGYGQLTQVDAKKYASQIKDTETELKEIESHGIATSEQDIQYTKVLECEPDNKIYEELILGSNNIGKFVKSNKLSKENFLEIIKASTMCTVCPSTILKSGMDRSRNEIEGIAVEKNFGGDDDECDIPQRGSMEFEEWAILQCMFKHAQNIAQFWFQHNQNNPQFWDKNFPNEFPFDREEKDIVSNVTNVMCYPFRTKVNGHSGLETAQVIEWSNTELNRILAVDMRELNRLKKQVDDIKARKEENESRKILKERALNKANRNVEKLSELIKQKIKTSIYNTQSHQAG
eukprot:711354_1